MSLREGIVATFKEIFQTALISFGIFLIVYVFLVQPHRVQGSSMVPNFDSGELLLTEKVTYYFSKPERGDVIVFQAPVGNKVDFIKRIIGLPGDTVRVENRNVYINGNKLEENYISGETQGKEVITLQDNEYFVLGDNRGASSDSRVFGPIKGNSFRGRAWFVYWPIFKSGVYKGTRIVSRVNYSIPN